MILCNNFLLTNQLTSLFFGFTTLATLLFLYKSIKSKGVLLVSIMWLTIQGLVSLTGFYLVTTTLPPRFILLVGPPLLFIVILFLTKKGKKLIDAFDAKWLTLLHVVRIPVEIVLFLLFQEKLIPHVMTFEGRNFDILSGITAVFIFYFGYVKNILGKKIILIWNFICLALLFNIVIHAILAAPTVFQKIAFDQPNIGVFYFPFVWLPGFIVPVALFAHLFCIKKLNS